jgi:alkylresorcinol/alkylpyrone synthase
VNGAYLQGLATAVPEHVLHQEEVARAAGEVFAARGHDIARLLPAFSAAGIETRHACVPIDWYRTPHGWAEKNALYLDHALDLLTRAAGSAAAEAGLPLDGIDAVVTVSSTGIATPSLDARLMERLPLRRDVTRLPLFGLGCAGGVLGLNRAADLARSGQRVLLLVAELCTLTFRLDDLSKANVIAAALFGDGVAALVLGPEPGAEETIEIAAGGEYTWPETLDVMGWNVEDDGLGVRFARDIPHFVRTRFAAAATGFAAGRGRRLADYDGFICHPGGRKVIEALEEVLDLQRGGLVVARDVLRRFGNMSAATALFCLAEQRRRGMRGRWLASALGPGFTAGFAELAAS